MSEVIENAPLSTSPEYFHTDKNGIQFGFHIEGGQTFEVSGGLSIGKGHIQPERPLFICENTEEWFPYHLADAAQFRTFKVTFKRVLKEHYVETMAEFNEYINLDVSTVDGKEQTLYRLTEKGMALLTKGVDVIILPHSEKHKDLSEAVLLNPILVIDRVLPHKRATQEPLSIVIDGVEHTAVSYKYKEKA